MVTFSFLTSCNWFTRLQMYTQHPVELSFIIGLLGSSSGVTLQIGLPSPSRISQVQRARTLRTNIEAWVRMLMQPTGKRLCSEWQFGFVLMVPVATRMREGLMLMGKRMLPSLSRLISNLGFFLLSSKVLLYFFFLSWTFSLMTLYISQSHSMRAITLASLSFMGLMEAMPALLTWLRMPWSLTLPSMKAGCSLLRVSFFSSTSLSRILRLSGSMSMIDRRTNSRMLMFLMNLTAISWLSLKDPDPCTSSRIFSSEMISWQFHLSRETIFSTWEGVLVNSLMWTLTRSLSSVQLDLQSWPMATPYSDTMPKSTFFSRSLQLFSSSSLSAQSSKSISPWFCWILTMVLMSFLRRRVRLSATGKSWQVWAFSSSLKQYSLALRIETQLAYPYLQTPSSRSMSFFFPHHTAGRCPNSSPSGMKLSSPSQLILRRSGCPMFFSESYLYLWIRFFTRQSSCSRLVYWTDRCGSMMCWSHSFSVGWYSLYSVWFSSISFCRNSFRFVSSSGKDSPSARRKLLAQALISDRGLLSSLLPMLTEERWICFHRQQPYCSSSFFSCSWSSVLHLLPLELPFTALLAWMLTGLLCFWLDASTRCCCCDGWQMQYTSGSVSDRIVSRTMLPRGASLPSGRISEGTAERQWATAVSRDLWEVRAWRREVEGAREVLLRRRGVMAVSKQAPSRQEMRAWQLKVSMMLVIGRISRCWLEDGTGRGSRLRLEQRRAGTEWMNCSSPLIVCSLRRAYSVNIGGKSYKSPAHPHLILSTITHIN